MRLRRMKRSSVSGPPCRGGGGPRNSVEPSIGDGIIRSGWCGYPYWLNGRRRRECPANGHLRPDRRRPPELPGERPAPARVRRLRRRRRGRGRPGGARRGRAAAPGRGAARRAASRHRRPGGRGPADPQRRDPGDRAHLEPRRRGRRPARRARRRARLHPEVGALRRSARGAVRVVVADDSVLLREGVVRLLEESGFEVVGQAGDAEDLLRKVGAHKPDVAVVDVRMPPTHTDEGLRAAHAIRKDHPATGVLVLSHYVEEAYALELLSQSTESTGYLLKDRVADVDSFTDAVRRVAGGGSALDPEVVALLLGRRRREDPLQSITPREREVLALMAEGRSNAAIAEALVVTERAVEKHVTSIFSKLDLTPTVEDHRRVLAVLAYLRAG